MRNAKILQIPRRYHVHPMFGLFRVVCVVYIAMWGVIGLDYPVSALEQRDQVGVAGGESTQQSGQQGLGSKTPALRMSYLGARRSSSDRSKRSTMKTIRSAETVGSRYRFG